MACNTENLNKLIGQESDEREQADLDLAMTSHLGGAMFGNVLEQDHHSKFGKVIQDLVDALKVKQEITDGDVQKFYASARDHQVLHAREGEARAKRTIRLQCFAKDIDIEVFFFFLIILF